MDREQCLNNYLAEEIDTLSLLQLTATELLITAYFQVMLMSKIPIHIHIINMYITQGSCTSHRLFNWWMGSLSLYTSEYPGPRSIIICDNASIHRYEPWIELVGLFGCKIIFLPPYSPHLNPIEQFFNILKMEIKRYRLWAYMYPLETLVFIMEKWRSYNVRGSMMQSGYLNFCKFG